MIATGPLSASRRGDRERRKIPMGYACTEPVLVAAGQICGHAGPPQAAVNESARLDARTCSFQVDAAKRVALQSAEERCCRSRSARQRVQGLSWRLRNVPVDAALRGDDRVVAPVAPSERSAGTRPARPRYWRASRSSTSWSSGKRPVSCLLKTRWPSFLTSKMPPLPSINCGCTP